MRSAVNGTKTTTELKTITKSKSKTRSKNFLKMLCQTNGCLFKICYLAKVANLAGVIRPNRELEL